MRKLALPLLAVCAVFAVSAPAAQSATLGSKLSKVSGALKGLQKAVSLMDDVNKGQTGAINGVDARVTTVVANLDALDKKVTAITNAATSALTTINSALTNSTTGLVGLNLARPQFGTFLGNGTIAGGTGQVSGASGPKANATRLAAGTYLVDFGNDVSKRALHTTAAPGAGAVVVEAVNCKNAPGQCPGGDDPNKVLVVTYVLASNANSLLAATTAADAVFTVTAISG